MDTDDARDAAIAALARREYELAGDEYGRAAWATLAEPRPGVAPFDADEKGWVGAGLQYLLTGALAYRVAGRGDRATHRSVECAAVARDLRNALDHPVQAACLTEFVADAHVVGALDDPAAVYAEAAAGYEDAAAAVDDPRAWATTPLFEAAATPLQQVARGGANGEIAVGWDDLHGSDPGDPGAFLAHRVEHKRQRFRGLVERAVDDGHLAAPRGTTAYGEGSHRCPDCGSTDVNWTGGSTLCLRCSTPMVPRD
ncbi:hypothetical protein [Haloarchaeobius iranensis]|uniref:Uncharacterized protein n=1 Tax=Haloarchaeobius iranensis TaxID=996166 RepID=A0A1G9S8U2_9EURY|nr:hypothetical protein [Haloarchaeobius iranensis]SDM31876.1 hypothetical protein SAMN05192554_10118 [Haloarchaeobius iranensis]